MKLETYLSPNCSELGLMITEGKPDEATLESVIRELRAMKLKVSLKMNLLSDKATYLEKLPEKALALLMLRKDGDGSDLTNVDKLRLMKDLRSLNVSEADITRFLQESSSYFNVTVIDGKSEVTIYTRDGCSGEDGILFTTGDSDNKDFPLLKKLEDAYGKEVYTIDGGHDEGEGGYKEFAAKHSEDK